MTRRSRESKSRLITRAPRKSTLVISSILYIIGLFGVLGFFDIPDKVAIASLAVAGGLLILGALTRAL